MLGLATTQAVLPHFRASRHGAIVNISSMGGRINFPLGTLYHGTKFPAEGLSELLHYELAPLGVGVKIVQPGGMRTDFAGRSFDLSNDPTLIGYQSMIQKVFDVLGPAMELGSSPEEIAKIVFEAATDESDQLR